ncbi:MAG: DNA gyrase C-terminal beta-propeller domain-containing protein, partial [Bacteroidota bacterium]
GQFFLDDIKERYGDERRTEISYADGDISIEDMIPNEEVVVMISHLGYIKRTKVAEYRLQGRGGRGSRGGKTRDEDFIEHMFVASTHNYLLLFTEQGRCHWLKVFEIPEASKTSSGRVIQNILSIPKEDKVKAYINITDLKDEEFLENNYIVFCTRNGLIKKTQMEAFSRPRANGIQAITINEGDQLLEAKLTNGSNEILIANRAGRAIRFPESKVRPMGRTAAGVRGISLQEDGDAVFGMICVDPEDDQTTIMVISEKGNGKRSVLDDYRTTNRGGKGVKTMQITDKTGKLIAIKAVKDEDDLMITNRSGIVIRMGVSDIRTMGRATQGVRVIRLDDGDEIADVAIIPVDDEEEEASGEAAPEETQS